MVVVGLGVGHLQPSGRAAAQNEARSYVQVTRISKSADPLHLNSKDASCGTASVDVYALKINTPDPFKIDTPDPLVRLELDEYSSNPPGVRVKITPESRSAKITSTSNFTDFTFKVCAAGNRTGTVTLLAIIQRVGPGHTYEIKEPEPAESARVTFDIVP
jgi:hypothetical protein